MPAPSVVILTSGLALLDHIIETGLDTDRVPRRYRMLLHGIGVGWALFWVVNHYVQSRQLKGIEIPGGSYDAVCLSVSRRR
jgi:hypothetical protein